MLQFAAFETLFLVPSFYLLGFFWFMYFITRKGSATKLVTRRSKIKTRVKTLARHVYTHAILSLGLAPVLVVGMHWMLLKGFEGICCYNHFTFSNAVYAYFFFTFSVNTIIWLWLTWHYVGTQVTETSLDYLFSLLHLFVYTPLILFSNTLLTLFFFLEVSSSLVLLSFASLHNLSIQRNNKTHNTDMQAFFNLVFYQFWSSFFSSILILYSGMNFYYLYGTTEWIYLETFLRTHALTHSTWLTVYTAIISFVVGLLIKLGVGPFFAYKLELYQGLPIYALCFYSLVYFFLFLATIFIVFSYYFTAGLALLRPLTTWGLLGFLGFFGFFVFDSALFRQFFALSSIITATNLLSVLL